MRGLVNAWRRALLALFVLSGVSGLIYQIVWVRVFGNVFGNTIYSASIVVAIFMLGLGVGSYAVQLAKAFGAEYLVQGTIAPDWIESGGQLRDRIKTHHNVGGLPSRMRFKLIEPLREMRGDTPTPAIIGRRTQASAPVFQVPEVDRPRRERGGQSGPTRTVEVRPFRRLPS